MLLEPCPGVSPPIHLSNIFTTHPDRLFGWVSCYHISFQIYDIFTRLRGLILLLGLLFRLDGIFLPSSHPQFPAEDGSRPSTRFPHFKHVRYMYVVKRAHTVGSN